MTGLPFLTCQRVTGTCSSLAQSRTFERSSSPARGRGVGNHDPGVLVGRVGVGGAWLWVSCGRLGLSDGRLGRGGALTEGSFTGSDPGSIPAQELDSTAVATTVAKHPNVRLEITMIPFVGGGER